MNKALIDKRYIGIFWAILFNTIFVLISLFVLEYLNGPIWYLFSSFLRIAFGILILYTIKRVYGKSIKDIIHFNNWMIALISGISFLIFFAYYLVLFASGIKGININTSMVITRVILQQLTTGFFEELIYRYLMLEGFFYLENKTIIHKFLYVIISTVLFGIVHIVTGWDFERFYQTSAIGFAFATIFINSQNLLIPMILHSVYDIFTNLAPYCKWGGSSFNALNSVYNIVVGIMIVISIIMIIIIKKKDKTKENSDETTV